MPRHNPDATGKGAQARARVADAAARLIMEHGISDYGHAKRKAARQLGLPQGASLPSNAAPFRNTAPLNWKSRRNPVRNSNSSW